MLLTNMNLVNIHTSFHLKGEYQSNQGKQIDQEKKNMVNDNIIIDDLMPKKAIYYKENFKLC